MMSRNRTNSATSLQSVQSSAAGSTCPHRGHTQLERLKTLKLASNRLTRIALSVAGAPDDRIESSSIESLQTSGGTAAGTADLSVSVSKLKLKCSLHNHLIVTKKLSLSP